MIDPSLRMSAALRSHEGRVRTNNEDSLLDRSADGLWVVADGMGGHEFGERASAAIVEELGAAPLPNDLYPACRAVSEAIEAANTKIWRESQAAGIQSGSTVVTLLVRENRFAVLWVGDSRAYLLRGGQIYQLSRDHTQVQEMVDRGMLTPEQAEDHPMGHVLARAVGVREDFEIEAITDTIEPGDIFLLCSDGLTGVVTDPELPALLRGGGPMAVDRLIGLTLERGAPDNVTVAVISSHEPTLLSLAGISGAVLP